MSRFKAKKQAAKGVVRAPEDRTPNPEMQTPKFCLALMRGEGCVSQCNQEQQAKFAETLRKLSGLNWYQIKQAPRQGLGFEILPRDALKSAAVPATISDEVNIIAFRYWQKCRML